MTKKSLTTLSTVTPLLLVIAAHFAFAEMVTFGGTLFVDRSSIIGRLYKGKDENIAVKIYAGHGLSDFESTFSCTDKWQEEKVIRATRSIADYINSKREIDPFKMLSHAGLAGCKPGQQNFSLSPKPIGASF